ncbi:MAG: hypothetical protein O4806_04215 [Trichodesmium sp. St5_bin8]|nr:hypothetical protein [Trichodesmium sp. St5_bin8]
MPSGTEEYFNKKKTLIEKCWGVMRSKKERTTPLAKLNSYSSSTEE